MAKLELSGMPTAEEAPEVVRVQPALGFSVGCVIDSRYEIRSRLGAGGMGAVYRAYDRELLEDIALKVVLPERLEHSGAVERLRREVKLARQITHPNVCRVFDLGESDGLYFLTMELVEGRTLRELLIEGSLPPGRALDLLIQIAHGVASAHAKGIVHRDLKPENVLVRSDGVAVVADFGIAHQAQPGAMTEVAREGTPAYMSPEQLRGEPIDVRSDVFALGVMGFEMLAGHRPFGDELPAKKAADPPGRVANVDIPGFPEPVVRALQAVLERAMAERPDERFASAAQLADPLVRAQRAAEQGVTDPASVLGRSLRRQRGTGRQMAWGALLAIAALGGIALTLQRARIQPAASDVESTVAVESAQAGPGKPEERPPAVLLLPFENRTGDAAWDGLAHGATEAVGAGLRTVPGLRLVEAPVKGNSRSAGAIEKATWVVRASVQRVGNDLRLAAQLKSDTGAASGEPIEIGGELSSLSDRLRAAVIDEARLLVRHFDRQSRAEHGTRSLAARAKLLAYLSMIGPAPRREHFEIGLRLLDEAIAADPDYVPALVERGYLRALGAGGGQAEELIAAASADLDRAAAVDGDAPSVAVMRCRILQVAAQAAERPVDALIAHAIDACRSALQADPASAYVPIALARIHVRVCQNDEAMRLLEQSLDLDRSLSGRALELIVALALTHGQIQVADRMSERLLALYEEEQRLGLRALSRRAGAPPVQRAHFWRGAVLLRLGRFDEARARFDRELAVITAGQGDKIYEATAIRGLFRIAKEQGKPLPSELVRRLAGIEAEFRAGTNTDPISAMLLCDPYSSVDPQVAVTCLRPMAAPVSCEDAIARAHIYLNAERRDMVRQMLLACVPTQAWERACIDGVRMLLGP